jgi:ergothioneine biosynthesis protein EgtB
VSIRAARTEATAAAIDRDFGAEFVRIRDMTLALCSSLEIEDCVVQSMPDASPLKWHLAHTTWFFEHFLLREFAKDYWPFDEQYAFLFNSYYQAVGSMHQRPVRGLLSRPTVSDVIRYRKHVDERVQTVLAANSGDMRLQSLVMLGLNHEQQHQELMLTDIKHAFSCNPLLPAYRPSQPKLAELGAIGPSELQFVYFEGGIKAIGANDTEFAFDNERPRHRVLLEPFALANRLIINSEYLEFIRDGGYENPVLWLSDGWDAVNREGWSRPLYWSKSLDSEFTLHGIAELDLNAPLCHVSYYEADAFARWVGRRLPTEAEWEVVGSTTPLQGNFCGNDALQPMPVDDAADRIPVKQMYGDVWEWTASAYSSYPGFRPLEGALGEYNGKFMSNRMVLRGGSCVTPDHHIRASYRNYFAPDARWQFSGVRLAQ